MKFSYPIRWLFFDTIAEIDDDNRAAIIVWLDDRSKFHSWFASIVTGSMVFISLFGWGSSIPVGCRPYAYSSLLLIFLSLVANLICIWSIPQWKLGIQTKKIIHGRAMRWDLGLTAWAGVIAFCLGLMLAIVIGSF